MKANGLGSLADILTSPHLYVKDRINSSGREKHLPNASTQDVSAQCKLELPHQECGTCHKPQHLPALNCKEQTAGFALEETRMVNSEHMGCAARFTLMTCQQLWKDVLIRNESGFA